MIKDKKGGVVTSTVLGVGGLIIGVIIVLVVVYTLTSSNVLDVVSLSTTLTNTSTTGTVNETGTTFGSYTLQDASCSVRNVDSVTLINGTIISPTNYTVTASTCTIAFAAGDAGLNNTVWYLNSTTSYTQDSTEKVTQDDMTGNFTEGLGKVSAKLPTILLIVAVVFLFGALVLLIRNANLMGIGGGGSL